MKIEQRSFGGEMFRPTPEIHLEENGALTLIATPWGPRQTGKKLIQSLIDFFHSARSDTEVTSPFQKLTCLSPTANSLRASIMLANDVIYREDNKDEYTTAIELFAGAIYNDEFTWTAVGQPYVLLLRNNQLYPLSIPTEATLDQIAVEPMETPAPLPQNFIGTHSTSNFEMRSVKLQADDRIVLISRSHLTPALLGQSADHVTLESISLALARENSTMPFWVGVLIR